MFYQSLLLKLKHYGFRGAMLNWFRLFLMGLAQMVKFGGSCSAERLHISVPRGSFAYDTVY